MTPKDKWLADVELSKNPNASVGELRNALARVLGDREEAITVAGTLTSMAAEYQQNEKFAAIKALEAISMKALEIAEAVILKTPNA